MKFVKEDCMFAQATILVTVALCFLLSGYVLFHKREQQVGRSEVQLTIVWQVIKKNVCSHKATTILVTVALCSSASCFCSSIFTKENKNATNYIQDRIREYNTQFCEGTVTKNYCKMENVVVVKKKVQLNIVL